MDFGIRPSEGGQKFAEALHQSELAEEYGFDTLYLAHHYGFPDANYWPSPISFLHAIASRTDSLRLGTDVILLPLENPLRLASEMSTLDVVSGGRTVFGFGLGWREFEYKAFNIPFEERGPRMTENLLILNELFEEGPTSFDGKFYRFSDFELTPPPLQSPRPKFLIGGESQRAFRRATRLGEGWISASNDLGELEESLDSFRNAGSGRVVLNTDGVVVRESSDQAYSEADEFNRTRRAPHHSAGNPSGEEERLRFQDAGEFRKYANGRMFVVGDPDECIEKLTAIQQRFEPDEVILRIDCGWETERTNESLRLLGEEVLPSF